MPGHTDPETGALPPHAPLPEYYATESERRRLIDRLFNESARHYAWIELLLSFGGGARYRRDALLRAGLRPEMTALDVAVGTGAVARAAMSIVGSSGRVVGIDPSRGMLGEAVASLRLPVVQGLAERLPFRDAAFDFLSMGYALRHVSDLRQTFAEYHRVLRPGGTLLMLDFARPRTRSGYYLARLYLGRLLPWVVGLGSRSTDARHLMRYCWDTVDRCAPLETVEAAFTAAGLRPTRRAVLFGVLSEYVAVKPGAQPRH